MRIWLLATLAAICVQPLVLAARLAPDFFASSSPPHGLAFVLMAVIAISTAAVLVLGLPAFSLLRKMNRLSWQNISATGFMLGSLPAAIFWPSKLEGYSSGQNWHGQYVDVYINGLPTIYAWLIYAENLLCFGFHGLMGAVAFYATWTKMHRS